MKLYKKIPFSFQNEEFEVRILYDENLINVAAFKNNYPANGFRYQIKISKNLDDKKLLRAVSKNGIVNKCKSDITEKKWEKLVNKI